MLVYPQVFVPGRSALTGCAKVKVATMVAVPKYPENPSNGMDLPNTNGGNEEDSFDNSSPDDKNHYGDVTQGEDRRYLGLEATSLHHQHCVPYDVTPEFLDQSGYPLHNLEGYNNHNFVEPHTELAVSGSENEYLEEYMPSGGYIESVHDGQSGGLSCESQMYPNSELLSGDFTHSDIGLDEDLELSEYYEEAQRKQNARRAERLSVRDHFYTYGTTRMLFHHRVKGHDDYVLKVKICL